MLQRRLCQAAIVRQVLGTLLRLGFGVRLYNGSGAAQALALWSRTINAHETHQRINASTHHDTSIYRLKPPQNPFNSPLTVDIHPLERLLQQRIVLLDGAMGTMIQQLKLSEADYRGARFRDWKGNDLQGSLELLQLTLPRAIEKIHHDYLQAGADVIETNTFSGTTIGLHDFLFQGKPDGSRKDQEFFERVTTDESFRELAREINLSAAQIARKAADRVSNDTGLERFVAGSMGPLPVAGSLSPDVNDPGFRAVSFDQLKRAYYDQAEALLAGGVDLLAVETVFDTLNAKAALFAISELFEKLGRSVPLLVSGTVTDRSGRTLSGQTVEAFLASIAHSKPLMLALNSAPLVPMRWNLMSRNSRELLRHFSEPIPMPVFRIRCRKLDFPKRPPAWRRN